MSPLDANYDGVFCELIRTALHHVADEETTLLPLAEVRLKDQLRELGWKMTVRRFELRNDAIAASRPLIHNAFLPFFGAISAFWVPASDAFGPTLGPNVHDLCCPSHQ